MITNFQENYFHPLKDMLFERLEAYGVQMPPRHGNALLPRRVAYSSLSMPGLRISLSPGKTWDITWTAPGSGGMLFGTGDSAGWSASFPRKTRNGIWLDVGVLFTCGKTNYPKYKKSPENSRKI